MPGATTIELTDLVPQRSDGSGGRRLAAHLGLLAISGALAAETWGSPLSFPVLVLHGIVLCALFCAAHECVHRTAFRSRRLNDVVVAVCGIVLLLPSRWFRLFHAAHHRYTQDPERDPELAGWKAATRPGIVLHAIGFLYWWAMARTIVCLALGRAEQSFLAPGHRKRVIAQARLHLLVYATIAVLSVATGSLLAIQLWVVPALIGQPFLRAFLLAEHTGCPQAADVLASTRSTRTNAAVRLLTWNMSFHAEHHARPQVPFHQLGRLHAELAPRVKIVGRGYARTYVTLQRARWRAHA